MGAVSHSWCELSASNVYMFKTQLLIMPPCVYKKQVHGIENKAQGIPGNCRSSFLPPGESQGTPKVVLERNGTEQEISRGKKKTLFKYVSNIPRACFRNSPEEPRAENATPPPPPSSKLAFRWRNDKTSAVSCLEGRSQPSEQGCCHLLDVHGQSKTLSQKGWISVIIWNVTRQSVLK